MDETSQHYFNELRRRYFPPDRNFLDAHLTLFHRLPDTAKCYRTVEAAVTNGFTMQVTGLMNLGNGVAFRLESDALNLLRTRLSHAFSEILSAQDRQGFRPHVTICNKVRPEVAAELLSETSSDFSPFEVGAVGLDLWEYLGCPWKHRAYFAFK